MTAGDRGPGEARQRQPGGVPPLGPVVLEQDFDAGSLYALRSAVAAHAAAAGLPAGRVYDAVALAHELAANAVRHGAGRGRLRLRAADGALTCQVTDDGPVAAGGAEESGSEQGVPWPAEHGHGLWVIGQVADQFTIEQGPAGTTATFTLRLPQ
jgi:anti-sigma regulatory factor (Ser/Thr protein kinase)